jgi:trimethylamine--corrinoid protein Co-methyltransferase
MEIKHLIKRNFSMLNRLHSLERSQMERLHSSCMHILAKEGIIFHEEEAIQIFQQNGFMVDGKKVFFTENQGMNALQTVPKEFTIQARNPEKSVTIGGNDTVLSPGWGAPFVIDAQGQRRSATREDSDQLCKLAQTSPYLDMAASSMVIPEDLPPETATAEMLAACFTLTDLPLTTNACTRENAIETAEIAAIVWGGRETATKKPVSIVSINPLSPLAYSPEAAGGLIEFARCGQALLISSMVLAGITGPITLAGSIVSELAETLAGIVLAQLVRPGAPCVFGGTSTSADMRFGTSVIGTPELIKFMGASTQMAQYYGIPCRYGGGMTDSLFPDIQAGAESAMAIALSMVSGVHYMHQACGILGTYTALSFEKFVFDEEIGGFMKRAIQPIEVTDETLGLDAIHRNAGTGTFLYDPNTLARCRSEFFIPNLAQRSTYANWVKDGMPDAVSIATKYVQKRLQAYVKPEIDPAVEKELQNYILSKRKG